jgi:glycosyltransferase involved in cell wall biosynthesis
MPAYNAVATLDDAVASVVSQEVGDWELVVADDGSSDGTLEIAQSWAAREPRVRVVTHPDRGNRGRPATRNLTVAAARGEIVAFLDADDVLLPNALAVHIDTLARHAEASVSYGQGEVLGGPDDGRVLGRGQPGAAVEALTQLARFNVLVTSATAVRREALGEEPFAVDMPLAQDWACWLQLARVSWFVFVPEVLSRYRVHEASGTVGMVHSGNQPGYELLQAHYLWRALHRGTPRERRAMRAGLGFRATSCLLSAAASLRRGRVRDGVRWLWFGVRVARVPGVAFAAAFRVIPEQVRIWRGLDPPLSLGLPSTAEEPA